MTYAIVEIYTKVAVFVFVLDAHSNIPDLEVAEIQSAVHDVLEYSVSNRALQPHHRFIVQYKPTMVTGSVTQVTGDQYNIGEQTTTCSHKETGKVKGPFLCFTTLLSSHCLQNKIVLLIEAFRYKSLCREYFL